MRTPAPSFKVERNDQMREIYWTAVGLWEQENFDALAEELREATKPFRHDRKGFRVMGDLREFSVQKVSLAEHIRKSQETSAQVGVDKMAIVHTSILLKQQFRRVSAALDCQFFTERNDALKWLRS